MATKVLITRESTLASKAGSVLPTQFQPSQASVDEPTIVILKQHGRAQGQPDTVLLTARLRSSVPRGSILDHLLEDASAKNGADARHDRLQNQGAEVLLSVPYNLMEPMKGALTAIEELGDSREAAHLLIAEGLKASRSLATTRTTASPSWDVRDALQTLEYLDWRTGPRSLPLFAEILSRAPDGAEGEALRLVLSVVGPPAAGKGGAATRAFLARLPHLAPLALRDPAAADLLVDVAALTPEAAMARAAALGSASAVEAMLRRGARVRGEAGAEAALRAAARHGYLAVVEALLEAGAGVHGCDDLAFRAAAEGGHAEVVGALLARGAEVRAADDDALCKAARLGHVAVVQQLLAAGADPAARDGLPLRVARELGRGQVVALLEEAAAAEARRREGGRGENAAPQDRTRLLRP